LLRLGELQACLMVTRGEKLPPRHWLASLFQAGPLTVDDRAALLRGERLDRPNPGATICACFGVGANVIREAVKQGANDVAAVGRQLRAGTNCGSCRPEIQRLIDGQLLPSVVALAS
jgi:assimilatory nitrate reductase catalytic subunit